MKLYLQQGTQSLDGAVDLNDTNRYRVQAPGSQLPPVGQGSSSATFPTGFNVGRAEKGTKDRPIELGIIVYGTSAFDLWQNWDAINEKFTQARAAAKAGGLGEWVTLWVQPSGLDAFVCFDVVDGDFQEVPMQLEEGLRYAGVCTLTVLPYARGDVIVDTPVTGITSGSTIYRPSVPGNCDALVEATITQTSGNPINTIRMARRALPNLASGAWTPAPSGSGTVTANDTWQTATTITRPSGAAQSGLFDVYARVTDASPVMTQPQITTAEATKNSGALGAATYTIQVVPYNSATPRQYGQASALTPVVVKTTIQGGTMLSALNILAYENFETGQALGMTPGLESGSNFGSGVGSAPPGVAGTGGGSGSASVTGGAAFQGTYGLSLSATATAGGGSFANNVGAGFSRYTEGAPDWPDSKTLSFQARVNLASNSGFSGIPMIMYARVSNNGSSLGYWGLGISGGAAGFCEGLTQAFPIGVSAFDPGDDGSPVVGLSVPGSTVSFSGYALVELTATKTQTGVALRLTIDGADVGGTLLDGVDLDGFAIQASAVASDSTGGSASSSQTVHADNVILADGYIGGVTVLAGGSIEMDWTESENAAGYLFCWQVNGKGGYQLDVGDVTTYTLDSPVPNGMEIGDAPSDPPPINYAEIRALASIAAAGNMAQEGDPVSTVRASGHPELVHLGTFQLPPPVHAFSQATPETWHLPIQVKSGGENTPSVSIDGVWTLPHDEPQLLAESPGLTGSTNTWRLDNRNDERSSGALMSGGAAIDQVATTGWFTLGRGDNIVGFFFETKDANGIPVPDATAAATVQLRITPRFKGPAALLS
jgi:hypothetical protein